MIYNSTKYNSAKINVFDLKSIVIEIKQEIVLYLLYVNANIVLSNELKTGFHDWIYFLPFYKQKFLSVGREGVAPHVTVGGFMEQTAATVSVDAPGVSGLPMVAAALGTVRVPAVSIDDR